MVCLGRDAAYSSEESLRLILQINNRVHSYVPMCLRLLHSLKLFFECQEQIIARSKHIIWFNNCLLFTLPVPTHKENQLRPYHMHYPCTKMVGVPRTDANSGRSGDHTGCRYQEGSRLHIPFLCPIAHFCPSEQKIFTVRLSVCKWTWRIRKGSWYFRALSLSKYEKVQVMSQQRGTCHALPGSLSTAKASNQKSFLSTVPLLGRPRTRYSYVSSLEVP